MRITFLTIFVAYIFTTSTIVNSNAQATEDKYPAVGPQILELQKNMMQDEKIMEIIRALQNDPQLQELLGDPDMMNAILSGDTAALLSNEKFRAVMNNPKIKEIQRKMDSH